MPKRNDSLNGGSSQAVLTNGCSPFECWPSYSYTCPPCLYQSSQPILESHTRHRNTMVSRRSRDPQLPQSSSIKDVRGHHNHTWAFILFLRREGSMAPPSPSMRACQNSTNLPLIVSKAGAADLMKWFGSHRPCSMPQAEKLVEAIAS